MHALWHEDSDKKKTYAYIRRTQHRTHAGNWPPVPSKCLEILTTCTVPNLPEKRISISLHVFFICWASLYVHGYIVFSSVMGRWVFVRKHGFIYDSLTREQFFKTTYGYKKPTLRYPYCICMYIYIYMHMYMHEHIYTHLRMKYMLAWTHM